MLRTILMADDDSVERERIAWCLRAAGYRVVAAGTGMETLAATAASQVDLLLLDLELPDGDGPWLLRQLTSDRRFDRIPVLVVTAFPERAPRELAVVAKPVAADKLVEIIASMVGPSRMLHATPTRSSPATAGGPPGQPAGRQSAAHGDDDDH
jgi:two-component system chemotaxis response regulator CheY